MSSSSRHALLCIRIGGSMMNITQSLCVYEYAYDQGVRPDKDQESIQLAVGNQIDKLIESQ